MNATATTTTANAHLDDRDQAILAERLANRDRLTGPRVGDVVRFADGVTRRFAHDHGELGLQTCIEGSFHLHHSGHLDMSGSLDPCVKRDTLTDTGETAERSAWFFHHERAMAHNGVTVVIPVRVYASTQTSVEAKAAYACAGCGIPIHGYPRFVGSLDGSTTCPDGTKHAPVWAR
jgi:hypothetical protein